MPNTPREYEGKTAEELIERRDAVLQLITAPSTSYADAGRYVAEASALGQELAEREAEQIARTLPDGDLAHWIANPKTGLDAEPAQHAAFVMERRRRAEEEAWKWQQELQRLALYPLNLSDRIFEMTQRRVPPEAWKLQAAKAEMNAVNASRIAK
jgi:hypothetical protein